MAKAKNAADVENLLNAMQKKHGKDTINLLSKSNNTEISKMTTGSIKIDEALGGGFAVGRIAEVYGPESSGKTTLTLQVIANNQANGGVVAFIDAEHALDPVYAGNLGVEVDDLIFSQPDNAEQALDLLEDLVNSGVVDLIVIDSVAGLVPKAEIEGEMADLTVGLLGRLMSKALRKIVGSAKQNECSVIFINQIRDKIGAMGYGEKTTTTGGHALKFFSSQRVETKRVGGIKKGEENIGNKVKVTVKKNKVAPPYKVADVEIYFGEGISPIAEIIDFAVKNDIINKSGSWFSYNDEKIGQGVEKVMNKLKENKELYAEIKSKVLEKINS